MGAMQSFFRKVLPVKKFFWVDVGKTLLILLAATFFNAVVARLFGNSYDGSALYLVAVLLVALNTTGYFWGLLTSICGVVGSNFFFTYPYFHLNFTLSGYPVIFFCMLVAAIITSTMTASLKEQMALTESKEQKTKQLYEIAQTLLSLQGRQEIASYASGCLTEIFSCPAVFLLESPSGQDVFFSEQEQMAANQAFLSGNPSGCGTDAFSQCPYRFLPVCSNHQVIAVAGLRLLTRQKEIEEISAFLQAVLSQFALALERQRLDQERQTILLEKQGEQMRSNLLRGISHDLRTPLTGILGASSAILENEDKILPDARRQLLEDIHEDAGWLLRMVENVLSVTKIGNGTPYLKKVPEPMEEVIAQAAKRIRKKYPDVMLRIKVPEELLMVPMDGTLIEQVLLNLLENAVQHGGKTPVDVTLSSQGDHILLQVRDYGKGIPEQDRDLLFDGFSHRTGESKDGTRGLGIGLTICRSIILAHGGTIHGNNAPDGGALFAFTLPQWNQPIQEKEDG